MRGAFAVVGGSGVLVSASRMDHGGAGGMARARSKAWIAATQQIPSAEHHGRMAHAAAADGRAASSPARRRRCSPARAGCRSATTAIRAAGGRPGFSASGAAIGPFVDVSRAATGEADRRRPAGQRRGPARPCRRWASPTRASTATTSSAGVEAYGAVPEEPGPGSGWRRPAAGRVSRSTSGRSSSPTGRSPAARERELRVAVGDRRPARRPDPAGPDGRRADRRAVRGRGGGRGAPPARVPALPERSTVDSASLTCARCPTAILAGAGWRADRSEDGRVVAGLGIAGPAPERLPRDRRRRRWLSRGDERSASSAAARSVGCTPPTWRSCPSSRCGRMTPRPSTSRRSTATACGITGARRADRAGRRADRRGARSRRARSGSSPPRGRSTAGRDRRHRRTCSPTAPSAACRTGSATRRSIAEHVPRVMRGVTLPAGRLQAPGVIHMDAPGPDLDRSVRAAAGAAARRSRSWRRCSTPRAWRPARCADARGAQWTKLLFNASTNPLCALTGLTHGELCDAPADAAGWPAS